MSVPPALRRLYVASGMQRLLPHTLKVSLRRIWLRVARRIGYPISSPLTHRPPLNPHRRLMRLARVLLACDLNPDYLNFWPSTRRAWEEIVGIKPLLVLVARPDEVPPELEQDEAVVVFPPVSGIHTTFQAQCVRLLYPALLEVNGAVLISDIDLYPLKPAYFHAPLARLDERYFVTYRDTRLDRGEVNIPFNAAAPATWAEIFGVETPEDVRVCLAEWWTRGPYDGRRGWDGWYSDQQILFERLSAWPAARERFWTLDDDYCKFNRLDRLELEHERGLQAHHRRALRAMRYSDFSCLLPCDAQRDVNDLVLELAIEAVRARKADKRLDVPDV